MTQYTDTLEIITNDEYLRMIQEFTQVTASNTMFSFWREADFWEYMAIGLSALAIILAVVTAILQWQTERNTRMSISMKTQVYESIFKSLLNDLYRIQCDILSLQIILMENDFLSYPTDRYLKKMIIKFDDSYLDSFLVAFDKKYKSVSEEHYLKMHEINRLIRDYNINIEMLMEHLKDSSIDTSTKLHDFSIINNCIGFLSKKIIQTTICIYGKNSDISSSLTSYIKKALEFYQSCESQLTSKEYYINHKKHEDIITSVLNDYFKYINITSTEEGMLLAYILISYEINKSDSDLIRNIIKFKP